MVSGNIEENMKWFVEGDNLENFITHLDPVVEDTAQQLKNKIESFKQIKVHGHDKIDRLLRKKVDQL